MQDSYYGISREGFQAFENIFNGGTFCCLVIMLAKSWSNIYDNPQQFPPCKCIGFVAAYTIYKETKLWNWYLYHDHFTHNIDNSHYCYQ